MSKHLAGRRGDDLITFVIECPVTGQSVTTGVTLRAVETPDIAYIMLGGTSGPTLRVCPACGGSHYWDWGGASVVPHQGTWLVDSPRIYQR